MAGDSSRTCPSAISGRKGREKAIPQGAVCTLSCPISQETLQTLGVCAIWGTATPLGPTCASGSCPPSYLGMHLSRSTRILAACFPRPFTKDTVSSMDIAPRFT